MRVTVVGCAGSFPGPRSPASCYLIEHDGFSLVLDLGNGALGGLQRYIGLDDVGAVALSHLHADHCLDLCSFYVYRRYHPEGPRPRIPVYGPAGTAERMARAYDLPAQPGMTGEFEFRAYDDPAEIGPFTVTVARVRHPVEAYGLRVEAGGHSVVYSGDTGPSPALVDLARGADVALFEASLLDGMEMPDVHMTGRQSAALAAQADVGTLVLTHLVPWHDTAILERQAREAFAGDLRLAASGMTIDLP